MTTKTSHQRLVYNNLTNISKGVCLPNWPKPSYGVFDVATGENIATVETSDSVIVFKKGDKSGMMFANLGYNVGKNTRTVHTNGKGSYPANKWLRTVTGTQSREA
jgi:hypothetical protein